MEQHKADRKQYWNRFLSYPSNPNWHLGFLLNRPICLSEIMIRPRIAYYVQHLCVRLEYLDEPPSALRPFGNVPMTTQDSAWQDFLAVSKCPYISDKDSAHWQEMLDRADVQTVTSLLLTLLPNLRTMYLTCFDDSSKIARVVNSIASASQSSNRMTAQPSALSKLCFFRISHPARHGAVGLWESFAILPSMRCMRHGGFMKEDLERWFSHEPGSVGITEVQLEGRDLTIQTLTTLCSHNTFLEKFEYGENMGYPSQNCCRLSEIASLLQTYAGHNLKELRLSTNETSIPGPLVENFVGSLQGFSRLEKLEITFDALVREDAGTLAVSKLVDIVPASLRELHIWLPDERGRAVDLMGGIFAGIEEWKQTKLPNFVLVVFRRHSHAATEVTELPVDNDTRLKCESCGISFEVRAWPIWRHQFY